MLNVWDSERSLPTKESIQRRLAWPLCKDDTQHSRSVFNFFGTFYEFLYNKLLSSLNIFYNCPLIFFINKLRKYILLCFLAY